MGACSRSTTLMIIVWIWGDVGLISKVDTVDLELICPESFKDGTNIITCKINQAAVSSVCPPAFRDVQFNYLKPDTTVIRECKTPSFTTSNTCPTTPSQGINSTCFCAQKDGDIFTYELDFIGSKTQHEGITLQFIICSPQNALDQSISPSCSNIKFDNNGGTTPGGTSTGGTSTGGTSTGSLAWIAAPIILGSAVILGIIFIIFHYALGCKLCGKKGCVPCCKKTDTPVGKCVKYVSCDQNPCSKTKPSIRKP